MATEYLTRIAFLDGQVLHDYHLNLLQRNTAEAIKAKTTQERYDMYLNLSPYNYYFADALTTDQYRSNLSSAVRNTLTMAIEADEWISVMHELPEAASEIYLLSSYEENIPQNARVYFSYRTTTNGAWVDMPVDKAIVLSGTTRYLQLKIRCAYMGSTRPSVYDYALMFK